MFPRDFELHILEIQFQRISSKKLRSSEEKSKSNNGWRICSLCKCSVSRSGNGYFGLLVGCSDAFCLRCIREYRQKELVIQRPVVKLLNCRQYIPEPMLCPVCKASSQFIMASKDFKSGHSKANFAMEFQANTDSITCNFLKMGFGTCLGDRSCEEGSLKVLSNLQNISDKKGEAQKKKLV